MGLATMVLTVLIGSLASFAMGRMRLRKAWLIGNFALLTYAVAGGVPGDPVRPPHARLRADGQSVVGDRGRGDVRHALRDSDPAPVRQADPARARRGGEGRWCVAVAGVSAHLPAADGAGAGRGRRLRAAAGVERISVPVPAAVIAAQHDGGGGDRPVLRQRRGAVELHDGDRAHLLAAADRDLLRAAPLHGGGPDDGRRQGIRVSTRTIAPRPAPCRSPPRAAGSARPARDRWR